MTNITLDQAQAAITAALAHGSALGLKPLSVAILDAGGHLMAFGRQDGSSTLRPQIAIGKAAGSIALGMSSRKIGEAAVDRPTFYAALHPLAPYGIIPAAGGVVAVDAENIPIGAIGVTGDTSDNDEACALAGLAAAGLAAQS